MVSRCLHLDYSQSLPKFWFGTLVVRCTSILPIVRKPPSNHHVMGMMWLILHQLGGGVIEIIMLCRTAIASGWCFNATSVANVSQNQRTLECLCILHSVHSAWHVSIRFLNVNVAEGGALTTTCGNSTQYVAAIHEVNRYSPWM